MTSDLQMHTHLEIGTCKYMGIAQEECTQECTHRSAHRNAHRRAHRSAHTGVYAHISHHSAALPLFSHKHS